MNNYVRAIPHIKKNFKTELKQYLTRYDQMELNGFLKNCGKVYHALK